MISPEILKYRRDSNNKLLGNCFATCVVKGLKLQDDPHLLIDDHYPELVIFNNEILNNPDARKEFAPALTYMIKGGYEVVIIDPDPTKENVWGKDLSRAKVRKRNYEKKDIEKYAKKGWGVVFSTHGTDNKEHAVLAYGEKLHDPGPGKWNTPFSLDEYFKRAMTCEKGRFLIAFKIK